ncbi:hypothetical protein DRN34_00365 [Thermococci archaeon]|nr:MAG: hypothetical protein DRN34_00365 [Thermococci archaeon]
MGKRKGRKRKKKNKHKFSKVEFREIVCAKCKLCETDEARMHNFFCYNQIYKLNPKRFIKITFPKILEVTTWIENSANPASQRSDDNLMYLMRHIFCESGVCGREFTSWDELNRCEYEEDCFLSFRNQLNGELKTSPKLIAEQNRRRKRSKKKKRRVVVQPYPTFICNPEFIDEIREILGDGNTTIEQNSSEKRAIGDTGVVNKHTEGAKP